MDTVSNRMAFGDFQTPRELADQVVAFVRELGISPDIVVEPTCGEGSFVHAALDGLSSVKRVMGFDIERRYVQELQESLQYKGDTKTSILQQDFFTFDWNDFFSRLTGEVLVIGNPPWVTNAALGKIGIDNLPTKSNFQDHSGFSAKTGKANFDISEWMLIRLLEGLYRLKGSLAMLCKTATARKVLRHAWTNQIATGDCSIHIIDAKEHFGVSVEACLFVIRTGESGDIHMADVYRGLSLSRRVTTYGLIGRELVADIHSYENIKDLDGHSYYKWRSGIKHDASSIMELRNQSGFLINGSGERVDIEDTYVFPLLKSSDLANGRLIPNRHVLLTQRKPNDDTSVIALTAPKTWAYLQNHAAVLDKRPSIIYRKRARFSVFGVGEYAFSPWKVAVSGLYKEPKFAAVGEHGGKPMQLDDTCYLLACRHIEEAKFLNSLLCSDLVSEFLRALTFRDAKRPLTIDVLNRISLVRVAERLGLGDTGRNYFEGAAYFEGRQHQLLLDRADSSEHEPSR